MKKVDSSCSSVLKLDFIEVMARFCWGEEETRNIQNGLAIETETEAKKTSSGI
jgi:hypothetical protein